MPAINKDLVASVREILSTKINKVEEDLWPKRISRCMQNLYTDLWKSTDFEIGLNIDEFLNRNMKINWHRILNENLKKVEEGCVISLSSSFLSNLTWPNVSNLFFLYFHLSRLDLRRSQLVLGLYANILCSGSFTF